MLSGLPFGTMNAFGAQNIGSAVLVEADDAAAADLPEPLRSWYGGTLRFTEPALVANFVTTIDGVVAIGSSWAYCGLSPTPCSSGPEHCVVHPTPYGPPSMPTRLEDPRSPTCDNAAIGHQPHNLRS
jgi:hypothetical protein